MWETPKHYILSPGELRDTSDYISLNHAYYMCHALRFEAAPIRKIGSNCIVFKAVNYDNDPIFSDDSDKER